ncbi:Pectinesterase inhibitor domain [Macleaya cordata]|uniref:Pectinesterase inhibitor domain n=1 Tax=Macleaya cordata TaxID=56857 RepID=A0A200R208_MACCD|nr:Pectinesterase inhibitor domain [Macleaya cordata]
MANPSSTCFILIFSVLIFSLFLHVSASSISTQATKELIDKICYQTDNYAFCKQFFDSNPSTASSDIAGLTQITLESILNKDPEILRAIQELTFKERDVIILEGLKQCREFYQGHLSNFEDAFRALNSKEYHEVIRLEFDVQKEPGNCENALNKVPGHKSPLKEKNEIMARLSKIALVTASLLV